MTGEIGHESRGVRPAQFGTFIHEGYLLDGPGHRAFNDVALLRLTEPFTINRFMQTVALPTSAPVHHQVGTTAGHPNLDDSPDGYYAVVRSSVLLSPAPPGCNPPAGAFCTSLPSASFCRGDSGSGFLMNRNGRMTVVGIASYGLDVCETLGYYAGLTDVYQFRAWILVKMGKTAAELAGASRMRRTGDAALGNLRLECLMGFGGSVAKRMDAPTELAGAQLGLTCEPGQRLRVTCDVDADDPHRLLKFQRRHRNGDGTITTTHLTHEARHGVFEAVLGAPADEFVCELGFPVSSDPNP